MPVQVAGRWPTVVLLLSTLHITTSMANLSSWFPQSTIVLPYVAAIFDAVHISCAYCKYHVGLVIHSALCIDECQTNLILH